MKKMEQYIYSVEASMPTLKAAAAAVEIRADDDMVIGGGIQPYRCAGQESSLRASALIIVGDVPICIISCDVLGLGKDICDEVAHRIQEACGIPFDNILISATHTHHAPSTMTVHNYWQDEEFCRRVVAAAVEAALRAHRELEEAGGRPNDCEAEMLFALGSEMTVGQSSRWLLKDGEIAWVGYDPADMRHPTGSHDPDLPVLILKRPGGETVGGLLGHATHNIGTLEAGVRSPGVFGLAARQIEERCGGIFLFMPGAFGSSHRLHDCSAPEAIGRVVRAVEDAMERLQPVLRGPMLCLKRPFTSTVRQWDEEAEEAAVRRYCASWLDSRTAEATALVFASMRSAMRPYAGKSFTTWLQVIRLGEVAIIGIPGEMFGSLGLEIRRRSPFRHTIIVGLANDEIGYIADRKGYREGGYQTWAGFHSQVEPGTGEAIVEAAIRLLEEACYGPEPVEASIDRLMPGDAEGLQAFYNRLGSRARRLFRPLGWNAVYKDCLQACREAAAGKGYDVVLRAGPRIVGWAMLDNFEAEVPHLGIGIADDWCGRGYGRLLMEHLIGTARQAGKKAIELIHVKDNEVAGSLYRKLGFEVTGEHTGSDGCDYWEMRLTL